MALRGTKPVVKRKLPKHAILTGRSAFSPILKTAPVIRSAWFDVYRVSTVQGLASNTARLGVIVPKAILFQAVKRNLVKRLIREFFRVVRPSLLAQDIVVRLYPKKSSLSAALTQNQRKLGDLSCGILKKHIHGAINELYTKADYKRHLFQPTLAS